MLILLACAACKRDPAPEAPALLPGVASSRAVVAGSSAPSSSSSIDAVAIAALPARLHAIAIDPGSVVPLRRDDGPLGSLYRIALDGVDDALLATTTGRLDAWAWTLRGKGLEPAMLGPLAVAPPIAGARQWHVTGGPLEGCAVILAPGDSIVVQSRTWRDVQE